MNRFPVSIVLFIRRGRALNKKKGGVRMGLFLVLLPFILLLHYPFTAITEISDFFRSLGAPGLQELISSLQNLFQSLPF